MHSKRNGMHFMAKKDDAIHAFDECFQLLPGIS